MATLQELLASARADAESYYKGQSALANTNYNAEITALQQALNNALAVEETSKTDAETAFNQALADINQSAYNNSQVTDLTAHNNGINFSQQYLAQMQGDQFRTNQLNQNNTGQRNMRLAEIANRINTLKQNNSLSVAQASTSYNNNLLNLRVESDRMYNDRATSLNQMAYEQNLALARQASLGGGGGGGSRSGSTGGTLATTKAPSNTLGKALPAFQAAKSNTQLDQYYANQTANRKANSGTSVVRLNSGLNNLNPIKAPAKNPSMTAAQVANMLRKDAGVSTSKWFGSSKKK